MNILCLDSIRSDTFGGYENWIRLAARWLVEHGHAVTVAGRPDSEYLRRLRAESDKIRILDLPLSGDFDPVTIRVLRNYLKQHRIDWMTVNFNKDVRIGGLAARWYGGTAVIWRMGLDITKDTFVHRHLTPKLVDGVFVPSEGLKRQVTKFGYLTDDMVSVIHTGLEPKEFKRPDPEKRARLLAKYALPEDSIIAVSSGRFVDQKGHVYQADAVAHVVAQCPKVRFLWLGDGELRENLERQLESLGVRSSVIFAGMLDSTDLELAGADLMVHSAVDEPFSHAVLEGMRAGLPLVATDVGGTPEAVVQGRTGLLVPIRDPKAMASAIIDLVRDPERMKAMGAAGQQRWREKFTVDRMMEQVLRFVENVIESRKPASVGR
ncbi:glycosyltransferase family 4 protein [bacterium]|nr:glycosyltransferase family 4 protein [bacterium]MCB2201712.1 glycosyltransferase family 4 protein [bacterium]